MADPSRFEFVEYNPRRVARGAEGVRVEVFYTDGTSDLLWMTKRDVERNLAEFGPHEGLLKAHICYTHKMISKAEFLRSAAPALSAAQPQGEKCVSGSRDGGGVDHG